MSLATSNIKRSTLFAFISAVLFGAGAPMAKIMLITIPPAMLAALLYLGSGLGLLLYCSIASIGHRGAREAGLSRSDLPWLAGAVLAGGVVAPVVMLWGLRRTPAATASLILNLESAATAAIASLAFREAVGRRAWMAIGLVTATVLVLSYDPAGDWGLAPGVLGVAAACVLWGLDNNLTRNISAKDPAAIVAFKSLAAGVVNLALALWLGQRLPAAGTALLAGMLGLACYGVSLMLFVLALRGLGTARTSAYFATAPFIGAGLSMIIFRQAPGKAFLLALPLAASGAWLLLGERHEHQHAHPDLEHNHRHFHDDGHHSHWHPEAVAAHSHYHRHQQTVHTHPHAPDIHHRHAHDRDEPK